MPQSSPPRYPRPFVADTGTTRALHFDRDEVQSRMDVREPHALALPYTRMMMGFLLFVPAPMHLGMIGLGGGSLAKFCHRHLPRTRITVVEINPYVIALRETFRIPPDDARFEVLEADGAAFLRETARRFDVLLVDAYDETGLPEPLAAQRFFDDCHATLAGDGMLVVNLHGAHPHHSVHVDRIRRSFDGAVLVVDDTARDNRIVFADAGRPPRELRLGPLRRPRPLDDTAWRSLQPSFARILSSWKEQA
jgi:spermidine synthase